MSYSNLTQHEKELIELHCRKNYAEELMEIKGANVFHTTDNLERELRKRLKI